jgi:hypothetical protein
MKKLLLVLSAAFGVAAFAQPVLGTVSNVQGVVTSIQGATGTVVTEGSPIVNGMRLVTTSSGSVSLSLNSGCTITLHPGQAVTVLHSLSCQQLTAAVQPVPVGPSLAAANPALVNGLIVAGALGAAIAGVRVITKDENLSPN